jgi:curved DNA-binding protein CbpA
MKLDSKYFDSIRVAPKRERAAEVREERPCCQWKGCRSPGLYRAPRGRGRDGQYYLFCLDHVRSYNASYNYFDGMNDSEVEAFQKDAVTGHRPTWNVGLNLSNKSQPPTAAVGNNGYRPSGWRAQDPHGFFAWRARAAREAPFEERRTLKPLERKSLQTLNLTDHATPIEIKARFKALVKIHHPDTNGGDPRSADKLREVIQAYNYLKQAGLV